MTKMKPGLNRIRASARRLQGVRRRKLRPVALLLTVLVGLTLMPAAGVSAQAPDREPPATFAGLEAAAKEGHPRLDSRLYRVMEAASLEGNRAALTLGQDLSLDLARGRVRTTVVADPEVQKGAPNAAVVLEQAQHPYDSFVTPDYNEVTVAIGTEIQKALQGSKTPTDALKDASDQVTAIVSSRES